MAFDWKEYNEVARFLNLNSGFISIEEAALRSAISRFYYAAFGHAREHALREGFPRPGRDDNAHKLVCQFFMSDSRYASTNIGATLRELRVWRNICDYENNLPTSINLTQLASRASIYANKIIKAL